MTPLTPSRPTLINTTLAVAWKDLRIELRSRETVSAMLVFALLAVMLFSFALEFDRVGREAAAAGVLWVTLVFAGTLGLGRSLGREKDEGTLDGLLLAPSDRSALYFGKLIGSFLFMSVVALMLVPVLALLFDSPFIQPLIIGVVLMGILGYAGVGVLVASMAAYTRGREVLLPVLLLPIALSILIPAVRATRGLLEGQPLSEIMVWINLLGAAGAIYILLAYLLFDYVVEE
jgi:heme exporter protein B